MNRAVSAIGLSAVLLTVRAAWANPQPSFSDVGMSVWWFLKTAPVNYVVDLLALSAALWVTGQAHAIAWRLVPLYNVVVFIAGYGADFLAAGQNMVGGVSPRDPVYGWIGSDWGPEGIGLFGGWRAAHFTAAATLLIFLANLLIIYLILRSSDADSYARLPEAAAVMAVFTAPYLALNRGAWAGWLTPLVLVGCTAGALYAGHRLVRRWLARPAARHLPELRIPCNPPSQWGRTDPLRSHRERR